MESRAPYRRIWEVLSAEKAMVFLAGPRQVGKTTLARLIAATFANSVYVNWDVPADRARVAGSPTFFTEAPRRDRSRPLVVARACHFSGVSDLARLPRGCHAPQGVATPGHRDRRGCAGSQVRR